MSSSSLPTIRGSRGRLAGVAAALVGLVSTTLALGLSAPAQAVSTGVVIAEVYGGGTGTGAANTWGNDFIELENRGTAPVSLDGWSVQYHSATGTGAYAVHELTGTIPAGARYLLQEGTFTTGTQFVADEQGTLNMAGGSGVVALVSNTTPYPTFGTTTGVNVAGSTANGLVDLVGYGNTANTYETARTGPALSSTLSANRKPQPDSDKNNEDFQNLAPTPQACLCPVPTAPKLVISEVFSHGTAGGPHGTDFVEIHNFGTTAADLSQATLDVAGASSVPLSGSLGAGGRQVVDVDLSDDNGSTSLVWEHDSSVIDLVGWGTGAHEGDAAAPAGSATESAQRDEDDTDTDQNGVDFRAATPSRGTAFVPPPAPLFTIAEVQGTGPSSPEAGDRVRVQGVVTASYPSGSGNLGGFYVQTGGQDGVDYHTPGASDAIFVFMGSKTSPAIGTSVEVTGPVSEFFGTTEISPEVADDVNVLGSPLPPVVPSDTLPGTDCALPGTDCPTGPALEAAREEHEGEAFLPTGDYTVTDSYDGTPFTQDSSRGFQMQGEFGLAANSTQPLMIPTELYDQSDSAAIAARRAYNDAHAVVLDDGADIDYTSNTHEDTAFPWLTPSHTVRVGASVEFVKPVILEFRRDLWRVQPQSKIAPGSTGSSQVTFEQDRPARPEDVGGDLKIATFNMLNYFNTTGESWAESDGAGGARTCSYYSDRNNVRISNNTCEQDAVDPVTGLDIVLPGPRGAANQVNFERQEAKELEAINTMDADVMSLEEVENSVKLHDPQIDGAAHADANRDDALIRLVEQLNRHWAATHPSYVGARWAYVPSPRPEALPTLQEQDAIRSAFIYNPSKVETVGRSRVLTNSAPFRNAREPLAQAFKPLGSGRANAFGVVVNHFKSKGGPVAPATVNGDNEDSSDGAGYYNGDRKRQAAALVAFSDQFAADKNIEAMFLTGDFNAYAMEDPVQVITGAGYHDLHPADGAKTYSFGGLAGSLDHVFANPAADAMVTGVDVWEINSNETVYNEYSRYNANLTDLYAVNPFRSSDHNPEIVGINSGGVIPDADLETVRVLATNDFHGRILDDPGSSAAGAASLAGAVKTLRAEDDNLVFAAAGDLIGASTFESFVANDKPTIDALNEAGLEVSAAGNHEFDQGYHDLVDRVMAPYDAETNPEGGAAWEYIAGNVRFKDTEDGHTAGEAALPETWFRTLPNGKTVGFVGAVTEDLPALVAGDGIADIEVTDVVTSVNANADDLKAPGGCADPEGCDLVVMLVHEGAANTSYAAVTDDSTFGRIVSGADEDIDAIVSGHTHLAYNHKVPVQEWIDEGRAVTERPVVSAGQYGANLNSLEFEYLPGTDQLVDIRQTVLALKDYDADQATRDIVDDAVAAAAAVGNRPLGDIEGPFQRARRNDPVAQSVVENRGGESTLGNLVAEIQRWKTDADIAFMNPGGLRADLLGELGTPRVLTYRQAADVQPFANTLVTMDLTGAQIKTILEQQWQRDADGNIPSRPFLRLGTSRGFTSTYDPSRAEGGRITGMWLDGEAIDPGAVYRVAATSFLASGTGDNFWGFAAATNKQDTGKTDLQAVVDYMAANAPSGAGEALPVDYAQHQVGLRFPGSAPPVYEAGDTLAFDVSSLAMTGADDQQDTEVELLDGDTVLGRFPVTNALSQEPDDEAGKASVSVVVPAGVQDGTELTLRGVATGTTVTLPIATSDGLPDAVVTATDTSYAYGSPGSVSVTVTPGEATGTVTLRSGDAEIGTATLESGTARIAVPADALEVGVHDLTVVYSGDAGHTGDRDTVRVTVTKAASQVTATATPAQVKVKKGRTEIVALVAANGVDPTGEISVIDGAAEIGRASVVDGRASVTLAPFTEVGTKRLTVRYLGDEHVDWSETEVLVRVVKRRDPD